MNNAASRKLGYIHLKNDKLHVSITYSRDKVTFLKSLPDAKYSAGSKTWTLDKKHYPEIVKSGLFPAERYSRNFEHSELTELEIESTDVRKQAIESYKNNPLSVPGHYTRFLDLDVLFHLSKDQTHIRASAGLRSKAGVYLLKSKSCLLQKKQSSFVVVTEKFPKLITELRDKKFRLAVEEQLSSRLKESAELRKKILNNKTKAKFEDLTKALLVPVVEYDYERSVFLVKSDVDPYLIYLFPDEKTYTAAKKCSLNMNIKDLLRILSKKSQLNFPIYLTANVYSELARQGFSQDGKSVQKKISVISESGSANWICLEDGRAGLLLDSSAKSANLIETSQVQQIEGKTFFIEPLFRLLAFYKKYKAKFKAAESPEFKDLISELENRQVQIEENQKFKKTKNLKLPAEFFSSPDLSKKLFAHQKIAVSWLKDREYSFLGDDMGLGKTLSVLACIDLLLKDKQIEFSLIVCPNSLTRNWINESTNFLPDRKFVLLPDGQKERARLFRQLESEIVTCDALVVNYEKLRAADIQQGLSSFIKNKKSLLCFDESQKVKNPKSVTFQSLRKISSLFSRRIALSGTPAPRDITDIWAQVTLLDQGQRFGNSYYKWLNQIAELGTKYSDYAVKRFKPFAVEETVSRVHEILLRRRKEEVLDLPEKTFSTRFCQMEGEQYKRYQQLCKELLVKLKSAAGKDMLRIIDNILEEYLRAVQIASNPRLLDPDFKGVPTKFRELDDIISEIVIERREKIVIWTNYLTNISELAERYKDLGSAAFSGLVSARDRNKIVNNFQTDPKLKILLAVPAAGGVGITLTAAQTAVYLDKTWNAEHWLQSVDRIHRIGQTGTVNIISLNACKVDELIEKNLAKKSRIQSKLLGDNDTDRDDQLYPDYQELVDALDL